MKIPLSIVMDELAAYKPESYVSDDSVAFSTVNIFPTRQRQLHTNHIYIGKLSDIFYAEWRSADIHCVAVRDRIRDEDETPERMKNIIVLNANCDPLDIFTAIQRCFFRIIEWNEQMKDYLIQNRPMQDILCLCEPIIGNYINVTDSSLGLIAHTAGLECDCPVTQALIANGYHTKDSVALFKKYRMPERWANSNEIYLNDSRVVSPYPNICKVVRYNNTYFAHVVMVCNTRQPTPGLFDLFRMLLNHLMVCFERQWNHSEGSYLHVYDSLITSLIDDDELSGDIIAERVRYSGLPMYANFRFLKVSTDGNVTVMLQRMGRDIMGHIPEAKATVYKESLAILLVHPNEPKGWFEQQETVLEGIMERYSAKCGISNPFYSIADLRYAHEQADVALKYGARQTMLPFSGRAKLSSLRLYSYESYYPCYLMCGNPTSARLARTTKASLALKKLHEYDKQHGTNNLELLFVYLNNDRKATETAAFMHMHRNNVIYRINRICEMTDMDLDDYSVRFRLLLAYEIFSPTDTL